MRAIAYVRVSTEDQATEGVSLDAQRAKIAAWCLVNDCELIETYVDAGLSGGRCDNRQGLQSAIAQACSERAALVVYSLSRLARSTRDTLAISDRLDKAGADLVSLSEKIDTSSAAGKMVFRMLAVLAEFERDQISERTTMALQHKRSKGERVGTVPFGFDVDADGTTLVSNPIEQRAIDSMRAMRAAGMTYRAIATELERQDVKTKRGNCCWQHQSVRQILLAA